METSLSTHARDVRARIQAGAARPDWFRAQLLRVPWDERDAWVHELFDMEEAPPDDPSLPHGAVPYLPCGVDAIVQALDAVPVSRGDRLVDLGSGLGKVALLAHLLTGAQATGVELQGPLVERAQAITATLNLSHAVRFTQGDTRERIPEGTVFFIYAAFNGEMLQQVLERLREHASAPRLCLCAVDFEPSAPWLTPRTPARGGLTVYDVTADNIN